MHYVVSLEGTLTACDDQSIALPDAARIMEAHLDAVMESLMELEAQDPDIEFDLNDCRVRFAIMVEATDHADAVRVASPVIRTSIHAAGGETAAWPEPNHPAWAVQRVRITVEAVELAAA
jgi:hypothetical protein